MKVLVARHGLTEEAPRQTDGERFLTEEGREQVKNLCRLPLLLNLSFDLLIHSPLLRARQTADIFCDLLTVKKREQSNLLLPEAETNPLFENLRREAARSLMLVGHQPFLNCFISASLTAGGRSFVSLDRGGMAFLRFPSVPGPSAGFLTALLSPRMLLNKV